MLRLSFVTLALFLSVAACKQGEGERCQIDDDCESGLVCNRVSGSTNMECRRPADTLPDAGPEPAADAAPGAPDATPPDAGTPDAGTPDAG